MSKHYFESPVVQKIGNGVPTLSPVNNIVGGESSTMIRTVSCRPANGTIYSDHWPEKVTYACSERPTYQQSQDYIEQQEVHGFGKFSIVARRWAHPMRFLHGHQWGMIIQVNTIVFMHDPKPWAPYVVRWFSKEGGEESTWAEDLIVIHPNLDPENLLEIVEAQGVDVTVAMKRLQDEHKNERAF